MTEKRKNLLITGRDGLIIDNWLVNEIIKRQDMGLINLMHRPSNTVEVCVADSNVSDEHGCLWFPKDMGSAERRTHIQLCDFMEFLRSADRVVFVADKYENPERERFMTLFGKRGTPFEVIPADLQEVER